MGKDDGVAGGASAGGVGGFVDTKTSGVGDENVETVAAVVVIDHGDWVLGGETVEVSSGAGAGENEGVVGGAGSFGDRIVDSGDGEELIGVPVGAGEGVRCWADSGLGAIGSGIDHDVYAGRGWSGQADLDGIGFPVFLDPGIEAGARDENGLVGDFVVEDGNGFWFLDNAIVAGA